MPRRREEQPHIRPGDKVFIRKGGPAATGYWDVKAARYASDDAYDERTSVVLSRGGMSFCTTFNSEAMSHICGHPDDGLCRDVRRAKSARFRPRPK